MQNPSCDKQDLPHDTRLSALHGATVMSPGETRFPLAVGASDGCQRVKRSFVILRVLWAFGAMATFAALLIPTPAAGTRKPLLTFVTAKDLGMPRHKIARDDGQLWIFNGRGRCNPSRYGLTGFRGLNYVESDGGFRFRFDFLESRSRRIIMDNVPDVLQTMDPLGWNFRAGAPLCVVAQDETWYPHCYRRIGTFHKHLKNGIASFRIETWTYVSARADEVLMAIELENRDTEPLTLTLLPMFNNKNRLQTPYGDGLACLATDLPQISPKGIVWTIPPKAKQTRHFAVSMAPKGKAPPVWQPKLGEHVRQADQDGEMQIRRLAERLPVLQTESLSLKNLYKRCLASLAFCRWQRSDFRRQPTWVCGGFIVVVTWDFSFSAYALNLVEPQAIRQTIRDALDIGRMQASYIDIRGNRPQAPYLYIQEPFALRDLINAYMTVTGDRSILDDHAGGASIYEWLKRWGGKLNEFATGPDGLIDLGDANELLLELRTDDYDHVVPAVNGLAVEYFRWLAQLAKERKDPAAATFEARAEALNKAFHERLWNKTAGWFDNLYPGGSRQPFFSAHLFDLLGTSVLTRRERRAIASHLEEGEFLGEFGMYSISRKDAIHWDRLDADWGGGGCYLGTTLRTARYLYEHGDSRRAWSVLERIGRLAEHFAYLPQSPMAEEPAEFRTGGNLQISSGAGLEAIWFGIFGLQPHMDGSLRICPAPFNPRTGRAKLVGFQFRGHRYDVQLESSGYRVWLDGKLWTRKTYGRPVTIPPLKARLE